MTMAKRQKSKGKAKVGDHELPEGWELAEEEVKEKKPKKESRIDNRVLWLIFFAVLIGFVAAGLLGRAPPKAKESITVNGILIEAPGDPVASIKAIAEMHTEGKTLDNSQDSMNALMEIGTVIGQSRVSSRGGEYSMAIGVTERTGIFIGQKGATIEGKTKGEMWAAVWTFNSIISDMQIQSSVPLFEVQDKLQWRRNASLVIDLDNACPVYGKVVSASSDIMQSLGFWQASENYTISQYNESNDICWLQVSFPSNVTKFNSTQANCPVGSSDSFVAIIRSGDTNKIIVEDNALVFLYSDCDSMFKDSVIARDLLAPDVLTGTRNIKMPTVI